MPAERLFYEKSLYVELDPPSFDKVSLGAAITICGNREGSPYQEPSHDEEGQPPVPEGSQPRQLPDSYADVAVTAGNTGRIPMLWHKFETK